ncbi:MAG TPA: peptide deformylase [Candidatus Latescibacteria bacterium]|nr:peptide deformylase [Gemmatimonadota bacterium]HCR17941.1 peptide deformylase [Candidatus Latescibacterota bacterium]
MGILKVAQMGNPVLRQVAEIVTIEELQEPGFQDFIDDMIDTMFEYEGAGLAAPQVHESTRVIVIRQSRDDEEEEASDPAPLVLVNPDLEEMGGAQEVDWEGCLSIPEIRGQLPRAARIRVKALDREGRAIVFEAGGFLGRVIQHEVDHLDGVLYLDRMDGLATLTFLTEFRRYHAE